MTSGTITLTDPNLSWADLGYAIGGGIYIQGTGTNGNGTTFSGSNYYTVASINGETITLAASETLVAAANVTATIAPITVSAPNTGTLSSVPTTVNFNNNGNQGTITLASGSWAALGYTVGQGVYIQGNAINANGATFTGSNYYTIAAISGATLTLQAGPTFSPETNVTLNLSPVAINRNNANQSTLVGVTSPTPAGAGNNIIIGGVGTNTIDIGGSYNDIIGHDGEANYDPGTGLLTSITTLDPTYGGQDLINVTGGENVILGGGAAGNVITVGGGGNVIVGDNGNADFTPAGVATFVTTSNVDDFGNNTITVGGLGDNVVFGGSGADTITVAGSNNVILGDNGSADFNSSNGDLTSITTFVNEPDDVNNVGGNDVIDVTGGNNVIIGGTGANEITVDGGGNTIIGHDGEAYFTSVNNTDVLNTNPQTGIAIETLDQSEGGNNTITINGNGNNVIFGGTGANLITVNGNGDNVIFGANGAASYANGVLTEVATTGETAPSEAFGNTMFPSSESNNSGVVYGGNNTITVGNGNNVIVGGFGAATITTGNGNNVVLGDSGFAIFDPSTGTPTSFGNLIEVVSDPVTFASGAPQLDLTLGGTNVGASMNNIITLGDGNNVVIGGPGSNTIVVGETGANVIIGAEGEAEYTNGILTTIFSLYGTIGLYGNNSISGPNGTPGGSGDNVVIGGGGDDVITLGGAGNTVIGDDGKATFGTSGQILTITTEDPGVGGNDTITVTGGDNVIFGGTGADTITVLGAAGGNVIVGDDGDATFTSEPVSNTVATSVLTFIETTDQTYGGDDVITAMGDGNNVIFGGSGADTIAVGDGNNVIFGDNGNAIFTVALASGSVAAGDATYSRTLTQIETTAQEADGAQTSSQTAGGTVYGGDDSITAGNGNNVIVGGLGADTITAGNGNNIVLGDSGTANFDPTTGIITSVFSTFVGAPVGGTIDTGTSNDDTIKVGNGNDIVIGGSGADTITANYQTPGTVNTSSNTVNDILMGGDGEIDFINGVVSTVTSTYTNDGGDNTISAGNGNDLVIGGLGANTITLGNGRDVVVGESGEALFSNGVIYTVFDIAPAAVGGGTPDTGSSENNTITVGNGNDVVIGGSGSNSISAGNGNDYLVGANGVVDFVVVSGTLMVLRADSADSVYYGNNTIMAGNGVDSIIGGSGSDTITTGDGADIVLGDNGEIVQAFGANGLPTLNSDGTLHRDVVLEQIGTITGSIMLDSEGDAASGDLAGISSADLILLAGEFNADGSQVLSQSSGAWETEALLVAVQADGNDTIKVGNGTDVVFGQGGNNTITAGNGNDTIFGDSGANTVSYATDLPHIVDGILIVGAASSTSIDLPAAGQLITPAINLLPSALTPSTPQLVLGPSTGAGSLQDMAGSGNLADTDGTVVQVFASVVPDLIQSQNTLPGNNTITVGNGNDVIFGNFGLIAALPSTGIAQIDNQLQGLSVTMLGLLTQLSALSTAQDALSVAEGNSTAPFTISSGNDHITVGNGNDTVFGDDGEYLVPGVAFAQSLGSLASNAVALDTYLLEMQEVFADMSYVVNQEGLAVINSYATVTDFSGVYNPAMALRAPTHQLDLDNDVIIDGSGMDLVIGGNGFVIMPGVGTSTPNWTTGVSSATLQSVQQQLQQLETTFDATLTTQLAADHPFTASDSAAAQYLFDGGTGFRLDIGNDQISGGAGNSILIGGTGLILDPVFAPGASGAEDANNLQAIMETVVDRLFLGPTSTAGAYAECWGVVANLYASGATNWSSGGGYIFNDPNKNDIRIDSDTISAGNGSDLIYGQMGVVLPEYGSSPGLGTAFYAYPVDEPGETSTANYSYAYGFGQFGSLQQWNGDPSSPSQYAVDADTITGGAGNNVIFGELGDDTITGGSGNDQISGGYGFNTLSGGGGTNQIVFNRNTDTYVAGGGTDITRSSLNVTAGSSILAGSWQSITGTDLAAAMGAGQTGGQTGGQGAGQSGTQGTVISNYGATELVQVGSGYYLYAAGTTTGPELTFNNAPYVAGDYGDWAPIGVVAVNGGYDVAWKSQSAGEYQVASYSSTGNYSGTVIGVVSGTNVALEQIETVFNQDLNGDGSIGVPGAGQTGGQTGGQGAGQSGTQGTVISNYGATELVQVGSGYYLYAAGTTTGPELTFNNAPYVAGDYGDWAPIGVVAVNGGYDVAWKSQSAGEYQVASYSSTGNYSGTVIGVVSGTNVALEQIETVFNQDLNGDGSIGVPGAGQTGGQGAGQSGTQGTVISNYGATELVQVGSGYYLYAAGTTTGPELTFNNAPYVAGDYGDWAPIGVVAVNGGYDVAWKSQSAGEYQVASYSSTGNYSGTVIGVVSGTNVALEQIETVFNQDLNGDGSIGVPGAGQTGGQTGGQGAGQSGTQGTVISNYGATELVQVGSGYYLYAAGTTTGPELTFNNAPYVAGDYGDWAPIGVVAVNGGYDVAWKSQSAGEYQVASYSSTGNYSGTVIGVVSGTNVALEQIETVFNQDLNGDGSIGVPGAGQTGGQTGGQGAGQSGTQGTVISNYGATELVQVGSGYYLYAAGTTTGPELTFNNAPYVAGDYGDWAPIGVVAVNGGYDVAWKSQSAGEYQVASYSSTGNYSGTVIGVVSGTNVALEQIEPIFGQDLNGDGVIGLYAAPGTTLVISQALSGASGIATIGVGATLELEAADSSSVTFAANTGKLVIDHSQMFTAQVIGFTGTGFSSTSDVIDIKNVANASATQSFSGNASSGTLTVSDAAHDTANILLTGNYMNSTFTLSPDAGVGTNVIDPPMTQTAATGGSSFDGSSAKGMSAVSMPPEYGVLASGETKPSAATFVQSFDAAAANGSSLIASINPLTPQPLAQAAAGSHATSSASNNVGLASAGRSIETRRSFDPASNVAVVARVSGAEAGPSTRAAVAREIVSAEDVIRAIKSGDIAIKRVDAATEANNAGGRVWLFDDVEGTFVAPEPEPLTIVVERHENPASRERPAETLGLLATAAMISTEPSWLGTLRQYGRKVAQVVQQRTKWTD